MMRHGSNNIHAFCLGGVLGYRSPVSLVGAEWRSPVWLVPHWIPPPAPPSRSDEPSGFILLERGVEQEYRPLMLERLQHKVNEVAIQARATTPASAMRPVEKGQFREVKTGVLLLPQERVEPSPGRRSVRRFLVTCLGDADETLRRLYGQLRELGWVGPHTVVVILGDGAEWIWNRAGMFVRRCEILDFWHALEHAWTFARLRYGEGSSAL